MDLDLSNAFVCNSPAVLEHLHQPVLSFNLQHLSLVHVPELTLMRQVTYGRAV